MSAAPEFIPSPIHPHTVYFMHGLESGPHGRKMRYLRSRFQDVHCKDMNLSLLNLKKQHTLLGHVIRRVVSLNWDNLVGSGLQDMLDKTLKLQIDELTKTHPDVLVGSSWGGAVAVMCIARGHWHGPAILMAPALKLLKDWGAQVDWDAVCVAVANSGCRVIVYHGTQDGVVPYLHSEELRDRCPNVTLIPVEGGDHRLDTPLITQDVLKQAILDILTEENTSAFLE